MPNPRAEGGGAIMVPADQVLDLRMRLSNMGLPRNSVVGYELLDTQKFGQTQAGEGMSMKRATEGELMRTIGSLSAVQQVRVHLALPQQNGFFREQQKPSASVMLTLHPGRALDRTQLAGIVHLVASSVPDLSAKAVSVVDGDGNLLTGPEGNGQGLDAQQLQYVRQVESTLQRRVFELLEPVVGRENLRATITAEVDFSESMLVSEEFRPNQGEAPAAVKTLQTLESTQPGLPVPAGVPGAQTNQPPVPGTAAIAGNTQTLQGAQAGQGAHLLGQQDFLLGGEQGVAGDGLEVVGQGVLHGAGTLRLNHARHDCRRCRCPGSPAPRARLRRPGQEPVRWWRGRPGFRGGSW